MLDQSTPRQTALGEPAHEAHIEQDLARAATGIASELGDLAGQARALGTLGAIASVCGRTGQGEALLERAAEYFERALRANPNLAQVAAVLEQIREVLEQRRRESI